MNQDNYLDLLNVPNVSNIHICKTLLMSLHSSAVFNLYALDENPFVPIILDATHPSSNKIIYYLFCPYPSRSPVLEFLSVNKYYCACMKITLYSLVCMNSHLGVNPIGHYRKGSYPTLEF